MEQNANQQPQLEIVGSRQLTSWMAEQRVSLLFTTYQSGKIFLVGLKPDGRLSIFERTFNRCMGLCANQGALYLSTLYQIWCFENALEPGQAYEGFDRVYVPQLAYTTGDLDIHDIAVDSEGRLIFISTLFSCLATVDEKYSFVPLWKPPFISRLAGEDRCHLNGLAMKDGKPEYLTAVSKSDVADGWREHRNDGGVVIDYDSGEIVANGLSMPHSPRLYRDRLWLVNSGSGEFGSIDLDSGKFEPIAFCPGYLRGLSFVGDFAVIGSSQQRENRTFQGLQLDESLKEKNVEPRCGLYVIDLRTGDVAHWIRIEGVVKELYDVVVVPDAIRPMAIGLKTDEIRRMISMGPGPLTEAEISENE